MSALALPSVATWCDPWPVSGSTRPAERSSTPRRNERRPGGERNGPVTSARTVSRPSPS